MQSKPPNLNARRGLSFPCVKEIKAGLVQALSSGTTDATQSAPKRLQRGARPRGQTPKV